MIVHEIVINTRLVTTTKDRIYTVRKGRIWSKRFTNSDYT